MAAEFTGALNAHCPDQVGVEDETSAEEYGAERVAELEQPKRRAGLEAHIPLSELVLFYLQGF